MTPVGRLSDPQWGWIVTAAIFGWIQTRCEQAIAEGLDQEAAVRITGLSPSPCDVAVVRSILPALAEQGWHRLVAAAGGLVERHHDELSVAGLAPDQSRRRAARDHGPGKILRKSEDWADEG